MYLPSIKEKERRGVEKRKRREREEKEKRRRREERRRGYGTSSRKKKDTNLAMSLVVEYMDPVEDIKTMVREEAKKAGEKE